MTDIQALNAIITQLGGTTAYLYNIQAYNAWSVLQGGVGTYTRDIDALNAIDVLNGGSGGHRYNINALNSIDVAAGGTGGHTRDISALTSLATLLNSLPSSGLLAKFLFFGKYANIADGKLLNELGEDWLTVTGIAGSETYQCPNSAPYIAADTDFIWFKTDESQRTATSAELVGYDFGRTIIKYDAASPYQIRWIGILKDGETLSEALENEMRDKFQLSVWWSNVLSSFGVLKGNRSAEKAAWTPEQVNYLSDSFTDFDNTSLTDHTMTHGPGWTQVNGDWRIASNKAGCNTVGTTWSSAISDAGHADVDISVEVTTSTTNFAGGIVIRHKSTTERWLCGLERDGAGNPYLFLLQNTTNRGQVNFSPGDIPAATYTIRVTAVNETITVFLNGVQKIQYTSASQWKTETKHGIFIIRFAGYNNVPFDNFLVK